MTAFAARLASTAVHVGVERSEAFERADRVAAYRGEEREALGAVSLIHLDESSKVFDVSQFDSLIEETIRRVPMYRAAVYYDRDPLLGDGE